MIICSNRETANYYAANFVWPYIRHLDPQGKVRVPEPERWDAMQTALKTLSRMIAISLVLIATSAFVLQGAALASGHSHATESCQPDLGVSVGHSHTEAADWSYDHVPNDASGTPSPKSHDHGSSIADSCCGKFCSAIACVAAPELMPVKYDLQNPLGVSSQVPRGIGPSGLKRPPRTIGMT